MEHRFYGESLPASGATTANYWAGLSVEANLADTAVVIDKVQEQHAPPSSGLRTVLAFGGSYSGATCAWMRQRYPHLIHAAVASSAPVRAACCHRMCT